MKWKIPLIVIILGLFILFLVLPARAKFDEVYEFIKYLVKSRHPDASNEEASKIASSVLKWCDKRGTNLWTILAIIYQESTFHPDAMGNHVSRGLMQLTKPALDQLVNIKWIKSYNWDNLFDIDYNLQLGTLYYLYCTKLAKNNRREAVARYRKTSLPDSPVAQSYADSVLNKRELILSEFQDFKKNLRR